MPAYINGVCASVSACVGANERASARMFDTVIFRDF